MQKTNTAVILCGGKGTRLGSLGKKVPKTLVKVQGREILWYILKVLKKNHFNHIILPIGYRGTSIKKFCKKNPNIIEHIDIVETGVKSNIGKRIFKIKDKIKSENFLLLNGDAIFNFNLKKIFKDHENKKRELTFITGEITYPYGTIGFCKNKVLDFKRNIVFDSVKIRKNLQYTAYNYTGMSIISKKKLLKFSNRFKNSENFEVDFFPYCIKRIKSNMIKLFGFWHSIDNLKDLKAVNDKSFLKNKYNSLKKLKRKILSENK